jgi:hypothetical protein
MATFAVGARSKRLTLAAFCLVAVTVLASVKSFGQGLERPQSTLELIDPKVFSVCADPHNMPFSTDKGEGFENKLAELFANKLGTPMRRHHGRAARR